MAASPGRDEYVYRAKLAEQAERYKDMVQFMEQLVTVAIRAEELTVEERDLLSLAYKNVVGSLRAAFRILIEQDNEKQHVRDYRSRVESELFVVCSSLIMLLNSYQIPFAATSESKVYYMKMKAEYSGYIAEACYMKMKADYHYYVEPSAEEERAKATKITLTAYKEAKLVAADLAPTHPLRLGLALNYSMFRGEVLNSSEKACYIAKEALEEADADLGILGEESYRESTLIMQNLRNKFVRWTFDKQKSTDKLPILWDGENSSLPRSIHPFHMRRLFALALMTLGIPNAPFTCYIVVGKPHPERISTRNHEFFDDNPTQPMMLYKLLHRDPGWPVRPQEVDLWIIKNLNDMKVQRRLSLDEALRNGVDIGPPAQDAVMLVAQDGGYLPHIQELMELGFTILLAVPRRKPWIEFPCNVCNFENLLDGEVNWSSNPLLEYFEFPPFDSIKAEHVEPGVRGLLQQLEYKLDKIEKALKRLGKTVEPSWPKLVEPLEKITDRLSVVWGMINHLKAVKGTPELCSAIEELQQEKLKLQLRLGQSKPIYNAFKSIWESPNWETLSEARQRLVEAQIKEAVLSGVALEDEQREEFKEIEQELEKLSQKFAENVLDAAKKFEKLITDKKETEGMPPSALGLFAQAAVSKGHEKATADTGPWLITLDDLSYFSVMQHAKNRALRKEVYHAYFSRASSDDFDNTAIIDRILNLRLRKAELLGYKNYAELSMATKMATVEKAEELLEKLRSASWGLAVQDIEDLKSFAKNQGAEEADSLTKWDITFWSERLRESKYDINEEELRPYFSLPKVMEGLFRLANTLFGVEIVPADGVAPVWNSDVRFYCVKDSGNLTAYFYFDPYSRPSEKRDGTWMDEVFSRSRVMAKKGSYVRLPVAQMVCNLTPPLGCKPSLMTFREVKSVFYEFGRALQHMLTKEDEGLVAGTRNIEWDAAELPSQFMANWCYHRDTLMSIAKHYQTGETLPENVYKKLVAARTFCAGTLSLDQLKLATVDLELHTKYVPGGTETIHEVEQRVSMKTQVVPPLPEGRFLCSFSHIFADGYAAEYYSYKWAEVLSADAFSAFEDAGLDDIKVYFSLVFQITNIYFCCVGCKTQAEAVKETGQRFRNTILAMGGGKAPLQVFEEFRGREPSPEPLLRHNGLLAASASVRN